MHLDHDDLCIYYRTIRISLAAKGMEKLPELQEGDTLIFQKMSVGPPGPV